MNPRGHPVMGRNSFFRALSDLDKAVSLQRTNLESTSLKDTRHVVLGLHASDTIANEIEMPSRLPGINLTNVSSQQVRLPAYEDYSLLLPLLPRLPKPKSRSRKGARARANESPGPTSSAIRPRRLVCRRACPISRQVRRRLLPLAITSSTQTTADTCISYNFWKQLLGQVILLADFIEKDEQLHASLL